MFAANRLHNKGNNHSFSRRDFLTLTAGAAGLGLVSSANALGGVLPSERSCIFLFLVGGPSHLDTWDPKPTAPANIRGPFQPIPTASVGMHVSENFPLIAANARRFSIVRSVHHHEAPIHETGHQLMQTGRLFENGMEYPHMGSVVSRLRGQRQGMPPFIVLPKPIGNTGVTVSHAQSAGFLGTASDPIHCDSEQSRSSSPVCRRAMNLNEESVRTRDAYGRNSFGQSCLRARRLIEGGARFVTVNMFDTVFNKITWDCHADGGALGTTLNDYRDTLCPLFDHAYSTLLNDLRQRGMLDNTLVVAAGEFGRTPRLNPRGGRDHWPGVWSILMAGGGIEGGRVIGASDRVGSEPADRPVTPAEVVATVYHSLGIYSNTSIATSDDRLVPLMDANPITELF